MCRDLQKNAITKFYCLLNGVEYAKVINGALNTVLPSLPFGDIIVIDNLSSHHYEGGAALEEWLGEMGIELVYTPTCLPDLNPIEECFSKIKSLLTNELVNHNVCSIKASVINATLKVTDNVESQKC